MSLKKKRYKKKVVDYKSSRTHQIKINGNIEKQNILLLVKVFYESQWKNVLSLFCGLFFKCDLHNYGKLPVLLLKRKKHMESNITPENNPQTGLRWCFPLSIWSGYKRVIMSKKCLIKKTKETHFIFSEKAIEQKIEQDFEGEKNLCSYKMLWIKPDMFLSPTKPDERHTKKCFTSISQFLSLIRKLGNHLKNNMDVTHIKILLRFNCFGCIKIMS